MKTIKELAKVWIGIVIGYLSIPVIQAMIDGSRLTLVEFLEDYVIEALPEIMQYMVISVAGTWVIWVLYKAIRNEFEDIKKHFMERKERQEQRA